MDQLLVTLSEKITSYNLFTNLFPGVLLCFFLEKFTRFHFISDNFIEQLFVWYFIGMIISRIGSICIEPALKKLRFGKKAFISYAKYEDYFTAVEEKPFIATLSETNNLYRTMIALLLILGIAVLCDRLILDWLYSLALLWKALLGTTLFSSLILLFVISYKKQTNYVKKQVEKHSKDHSAISKET